MRCLFSVLLFAACGPSSSSGTDAPAGGDAATDSNGSGIDYDTGTWESQVAVDTAGTISHDPAGVFTNDGTFWGTWMEPDVDATSGEDIWEMRLPRGGTWATDRLTDDGTAQAAYNSLATDGTAVHLAYNSRTGADNDIFYSKHAGTAWSMRIDVTTPGEAVARHDFQTDIAVAPNGEAVIAYVSTSVSMTGGFGKDGEIRVARIAANGTVSGAPVVAIPTVAPDGCFDPSIVVDAEGTVHVAADCGAAGAEEILYSENSSGTYSTPVPLPGGVGRDDYGVKLALGPDNRTLHAIWSAVDASKDCRYSRKPSGAAWTESISANNGAAANDHACSLAVDGSGNVLTAWHRANANNAEDVFFAWSSDGMSFHAPRVVTPDTDTTTEWFPDTIAIEPGTGAVHMLYERLVPNTDPLNEQIMHAKLTLPAQ